MSFIFRLLLLSLCVSASAPAQDPKPAEWESFAYTDYTMGSALIVEFKALAVDEESPFAAHLTNLADFSAPIEGQVTVTLSGGGQPPEWQVEFATAVVEPKALRASMPATGMLRSPANAEATVSAPSSGLVIFPDRTPLVGYPVERGQLLATIVPRLAERGDMALLVEEANKAQLRHDQAHREQDRAQMLLESGIVAERLFLATRTAHQLATPNWRRPRSG